MVHLHALNWTYIRKFGAVRVLEPLEGYSNSYEYQRAALACLVFSYHATYSSCFVIFYFFNKDNFFVTYSLIHQNTNKKLNNKYKLNILTDPSKYYK